MFQHSVATAANNSCVFTVYVGVKGSRTVRKEEKNKTEVSVSGRKEFGHTHRRNSEGTKVREGGKGDGKTVGSVFWVRTLGKRSRWRLIS